MTDKQFAFGGFRLDASRRLLFDVDGAVVPLNARAFDTLLFFVENSQQLLDKPTLLAAIWPNTVVEDNNLSQCILALRRALGERPGEHRFIVTVPGRGYRFVARVEALASPVSRRPELASTTSLPSLWHIRALAIVGLLLLATVVGLTAGRSELRRRPAAPTSASVAILPFSDLSPARDQGQFSDGVSDELLSQLGSQRGIDVIARSSSFVFKDNHEDVRRVGRKLGADYVLEGSVRNAAGRIRVTVHLVETLRGTRIWSDSYERESGDPLMLQDEIARAIAPDVVARIDNAQYRSSKASRN